MDNTQADDNVVLTALVADDEAISRQMIAYALRQEGFDCDLAEDGIEAAEKVRAKSYDVVITDLQMPRKSGVSLTGDLLALRPAPLIIVHTAVFEPAVAKELIAAGVDDIVFKPVDYVAFAGKVRALCTRRDTQRQFQMPGPTSLPEAVPPSHAGQQSAATPGEQLHDVLIELGLADHADQVEQYRLGRLLGEGAMGEVWEAEHKLLGRACAIKFIRPELLSDESVRKRFSREVRCAAKLTHWNNVSIFDFGLTRRGHFYCVMELLHGRTLQQLLDVAGALPPGRVLHFLAQACDGLGEAHRLGLVHRDLKPSNLMVTESQTHTDLIKILDFGLVLETLPSVDDAAVLTQRGGICGTPAYMAPEQIQSPSTIDARADIYSLGATGYALLTGRPPFAGDNPVAVACAHLHAPVTPPRDINPAVLPELDRIIMKCLEKAADGRYPTTAALGEELRRCELFGSWAPSESDAAEQLLPSNRSTHLQPVQSTILASPESAHCE